MIRIITGTFGWTGAGALEAVTAASGPRSFPTDIEARLVREGVAEYVSGAPERRQPAPAAPAAPATDIDDLPPGVPAYSDDMTKAQLAAIMDEAGIAHSDGMTKTAMLLKLDSYYRG